MRDFQEQLFISCRALMFKLGSGCSFGLIQNYVARDKVQGNAVREPPHPLPKAQAPKAAVAAVHRIDLDVHCLEKSVTCRHR